MADLKTLNILRLKKVKERTGLSCSSVYLKMTRGTFPRQIMLGGGRAVGWIESEITEWIQAQIDRSRAA